MAEIICIIIIWAIGCAGFVAFVSAAGKISEKPEDIICPVCGYYCLGKGGMGCIDKPFIVDMDDSMLADRINTLIVDRKLRD